MAQIHVLDSETIDKIAAGEVVERPSSVVKELVENSIDAGATAITVETKEGGIEFLRVTDNGSGIDSRQIRTAFLRHATSKIADSDDLLRIASLGFRGEALSSIAAVSRVEIISRTKSTLVGCRLILEGGVERSFEEVGAPEGTTFLMRNLFFNTPARRKFLKQAATEGGYIADLMEHIALSRPDISFKLVQGNQLRFHTSGNGDLREVVYRIYGREISREILPIQAERDGIRIEGFLGKPTLVRSNRNFEIYFINGRFIRSNVMAKAIEEGYREYLMQHKFPFCILHIVVDPARVDVNVHPSKMDVRFDDGPGVYRIVSGLIFDALKNREMIPEAALPGESDDAPGEKEKRAGVSVPEPFELRRAEVSRVAEEASYRAEAPKKPDFSQNPVWLRVTGEKSVREEKSVEAADDFFVEAPEDTKAQEVVKAQESTEQPDRAKRPESAGQPDRGERTENDRQPDRTKQPENAGIPENTGIPESAERASMSEPGSSGADAAPQKSAYTQENLFDERILTRENRQRYRVIGQVFDTYWLVQFEDKLLIVDQHAAHEKVKYERLMKRYRDKAIVSQGLLPPAIVSLSGQEEAVYLQYADTFAGLGFEIEAFGGHEYAFRGIPADLCGCSGQELFLAVLDELAEGNSRGSFSVVEEKIASMACKAAVKGNNRMSTTELEALLDELLGLENPYNCPHGRPTIITVSQQELERKFKRIV